MCMGLKFVFVDERLLNPFVPNVSLSLPTQKSQNETSICYFSVLFKKENDTLINKRSSSTLQKIFMNIKYRQMEDKNTPDITATLYLANIKTKGKNHK